MADTLHANNLINDRNLGARWEANFMRLAASHGKSFVAHQLNRTTSAVAMDRSFNPYTMPDITILTSPGEHHEIKHKAPFESNWRRVFGLEVYRFNALIWFASETGQDVMYTIHNHSLSGGRDSDINDLNHWVTANVLSLLNRWAYTRLTNSYVNGQKKEVDCHYWDVGKWVYLADYWNQPKAKPEVIAKTQVAIAKSYWDNPSFYKAELLRKGKKLK